MSNITPADGGTEVPAETPPMPEPISPVEPDNIGEEFEGGEHFRVTDPDRPATEDVVRCLP